MVLDRVTEEHIFNDIGIECIEFAYILKKTYFCHHSRSKKF